MYNLYFFTFNNYYNRQVKRYDTLAAYQQLGTELGNVNANFDMGDGVNTQYVLQHVSWNLLAAVPDYMLLIDPNTNNILSRWFVIEAVKINGAQYQIFLRRDLVADFYDVVVGAPAFIEKATLKTSDPLIWNSENMTFNQIKIAELEIRDKTQIPWVVGYYAMPKPDDENDESNGPVAVGVAEYDIDETVNGISNYRYYRYTTKPYYYLTKAQLQINAWHDNFNGSTQYKFFPQDNYYTEESVSDRDRVGYQAVFIKPQNALKRLVDNLGDTDIQQEFINTVLAIDGITENQLLFLNQEAGKVIKDTSTNTIYRVNIRVGPVNNWSKPSQDIKSDSNYSTIRTKTETLINADFTTLFAENPFYQYNISQQQITFSLDEITPTTGHYINIDATRRTLNDSPYCMFAMPYGSIDIIYPTESGKGFLRTNKANALTIGAGLMANKPGFVYDVQILPFCPIEKVRRVIQYNTIDMSSFTDAVDYTTSAYGIKQVIFWAETSQGSIDISVENMTMSNLTPEQIQDLIINKWAYNYNSWRPEEVKVVNECSMYRLCSPNYASMFEYNLAKNGGINSTDMTEDPIVFHVDYGYKPYNPYIRVAPIFGGLYGTNFNDARGLILSGDFSITSITNQWAQYELQNKNYQQAFDRQIENMEIQNKYARQQDIVNAITGTAQGAMSGAMAGMMTGNPIVGAAGAGIGGIASLAGGIADVNINRNLRNEALDYTKDQFGFTLGNIKALPHTINKVSAINPNFRYFPILEIYDATDDEKNALKQKLKYNGMTVGRINTISAYIQEDPTYIKAQIIRFEGISEDTHILNELANEIFKGVYI